jgi:cytochrome c peroxidase
MPMKHIFNRRVRPLFVGSAVVLAFGAVVISAQTVVPESFTALVSRLQQEKPTFAKRHQDLHAVRYDMADRAAPGVTMSRGKSVQDGVRVKLPANATWDKLASMTPEAIKTQNLWPAGFLPLPHPHHEAGGMLFPKTLIDETKRQTDRDLTRFDLDFDLPDHLLPEFPAVDRDLVEQAFRPEVVHQVVRVVRRRVACGALRLTEEQRLTPPLALG